MASILFRALRPLFLLGADVAVNVGEESASSRVKWNAKRPSPPGAFVRRVGEKFVSTAEPY